MSLQYPRVKCLPQSSANGQTKGRDIRTSAHFELSQHDGMPCREFEPTTYLLLLLNCYPLHLTPFYIFTLTSIYASTFFVEFPLQADKWFSKVDRHFQCPRREKHVQKKKNLTVIQSSPVIQCFLSLKELSLLSQHVETFMVKPF